MISTANSTQIVGRLDNERSIFGVGPQWTASFVDRVQQADSGVRFRRSGFIGPTDPLVSADRNLREKFNNLRPIDHFESRFLNAEGWSG